MSIKYKHHGETIDTESDHIKLTTAQKYLDEDIEIEAEGGGGGNAQIELASAEGWNADKLDLTVPFTKYGTYGYAWDTINNRLVPENVGHNNSFAMAKIPFTIYTACDITVTMYQSSEKLYDYGFLSKLDTMLGQNGNATDSNGVNLGGTGGASYGSKGLDGTFTYTFTNVSVGEHYITVKYRKDNSAQTGLDIFAIVSIQASVAQEIRSKTWVDTGEDIDIVRWSDKSIDTPTETITIEQNGTYDVSDKASAVVSVSGGGGDGIPCYVTFALLNNEESDIIFDGNINNGSSNGAIPTPICFNIGKFQLNLRDYQSDNSSQWRPHGSGAYSAIPIGVEHIITQSMDIVISLGSCLLEGTMILMADGSEKAIERIEVGDMVMSYHGPVKVIGCDTNMVKRAKWWDEWIFEDGTVLHTVHQHRFYNCTKGCYCYLARYEGEDDGGGPVWDIGDEGLNRNGERVKLVSHIHHEEECRHFTIYTDYEDGDGSYYADGMLSGNRRSKPLGEEV